MRFLKAILWLMIVLVPFSGLLYSLTYLELEIIGEGSPMKCKLLHTHSR